MDQQFRMLPGLFDPAREAFYSKRDIEDVMPPGADTSIAHTVEMWVMAHLGRAASRHHLKSTGWYSPTYPTPDVIRCKPRSHR